MPTPVDEAVLHTPQIANYLLTADRRIVIGFRIALELLGVAVPEAALRRPNGRRSVASMMKDYTANNMPSNFDRLNDDILNHI